MSQERLLISPLTEADLSAVVGGSFEEEYGSVEDLFGDHWFTPSEDDCVFWGGKLDPVSGYSHASDPSMKMPTPVTSKRS